MYKVLTIGDSGVGKSSLILRYADDSFSDAFISTIGSDYKSKELDVEGTRIKLQLWDTAGQERFRTITSSYYRGSHAVLVCFDLSNAESFKNVHQWFVEVTRYANTEIALVLVGLKRDLVRVVTAEEANELVDRYAVRHYIECSSKTSENVTKVFEITGKAILENPKLNHLL